MTQTKYQKDVLKMADSNHIWLKASYADSNNDETCRDIGRNILEMLSEEGNLIPCQFNLKGLQQKELIIRINKS